MINITTKKNRSDLGFGTFNDLIDTVFGEKTTNIMRTDIHETENTYEFEIDLPGFDKKNIKVSEKDGYLLVEASRNSETEENKKNYVRTERQFGEYSRRYYVGEAVEKDIKAKYENGVLALSIPKKKPVEPKENIIEIE